MTDAALTRLVDRLAVERSSEDRHAIERMLIYLHRASLPVLRVLDEEGELSVVCGEVDQFCISVEGLIELWAGLERGQAIVWEQLDRAH